MQLGVRDYLAEMSRLVTPDPATASMQALDYAYAACSPARYVDPEGLYLACTTKLVSVVSEQPLPVFCGGSCRKNGVPGRWVRGRRLRVTEKYRVTICTEYDRCNRPVHTSYSQEQLATKHETIWDANRYCATVTDQMLHGLCGYPEPPKAWPGEHTPVPIFTGWTK